MTKRSTNAIRGIVHRVGGGRPAVPEREGAQVFSRSNRIRDLHGRRREIDSRDLDYASPSYVAWSPAELVAHCSITIIIIVLRIPPEDLRTRRTWKVGLHSDKCMITSATIGVSPKGCCFNSDCSLNLSLCVCVCEGGGVMTIARLGLKVNAIGQGQRSIFSVWAW